MPEIKNGKTRIFVYVTRTLKFRVLIEELDNPFYGVTVNDENWREGLGQKHRDKIKEEINTIMDALKKEVNKI